MLSGLSERRAIVTGAGSGIGRATALRLVAEGVAVLGVDRVAERLATVAAEAGPRMTSLALDLTDAEAPARVMTACRERFGEPDLLVNVAGVGDAKALHLTDDADLDRFIDINLRSVFRLSREFVRAAPSGAAIVNIVSVYALLGFINSAPYTATKAALVGLTRQMAADYGRRGIRVNAVAPGVIVTPLNAERLDTNAWYRDTMLNATPLGRFGAPEEIAAAIAFLCSGEASFITGQTLAVDGGWSVAKFTPPPA